MNSSVYHINKGINKPIEFKGLKAQYIWWLGGGLVALLILFAIGYIAGVNVFICIIIVGTLGAALFILVYKYSRNYGEYGLLKKIAKSSIPKVIKNYTITQFKQRLLHEKFD